MLRQLLDQPPASSGTPRGLISTTRAPGSRARAASMAAVSGSGFITIPAPAAVGSVVGDPVPARGVLADVRHPHRRGARSPAPSRGCSPPGTPRTCRGKSVRISTSSFATSVSSSPRRPAFLPLLRPVQQPLGRVHHDPAPLPVHLDVRSERHQPLTPGPPAPPARPRRRSRTAPSPFPPRSPGHRHHRQSLEVGPEVASLAGLAQLLPPRPAPRCPTSASAAVRSEIALQPHRPDPPLRPGLQHLRDPARRPDRSQHHPAHPRQRPVRSRPRPAEPSSPTARTTLPSADQRQVSRGCRARPAALRGGRRRRARCGRPWRSGRPAR